jgi:hypothetical protein
MTTIGTEFDMDDNRTNKLSELKDILSVIRIHCFDHPPLDPLPSREGQEGMILPSRQGKVRCCKHLFFRDKVNHESINSNKWQDIVFERFLLPIVQKKYLYCKEAKASEGDSPRMSENTISCHNGNGNAS